MRSIVHLNTPTKQSNGTTSAVWNEQAVDSAQEDKAFYQYSKPLTKPGAAGSADGKPSQPPRIGFDFSKIPVFSTLPARIQPKLKINAPGDKYEQEADIMADRVIGMATHSPPADTPDDTLQRKCTHCEEEDKKKEKKADIMRKAEGSGCLDAPPSLIADLQASKGNGLTLPGHVRTPLENAFGADFSGVRIHIGARAAAMSSSIQARAFTHGRDIFFNNGEFQPEVSKGKQLLSHELVHVLQQGNRRDGFTVQRKTYGSEPKLSKSLSTDKRHTGSIDDLIKSRINNLITEIQQPVPTYIKFTHLLNVSTLPDIPVEFLYRFSQYFVLGLYKHLDTLPDGEVESKFMHLLTAPFTFDYQLGNLRGLPQGVWTWIKDMVEMIRDLFMLPITISKFIYENMPDAIVSSHKIAQKAIEIFESKKEIVLKFAVEVIFDINNNSSDITDIIRTKAFSIAQDLGGSASGSLMKFAGKSDEEIGRAIGEIQGYIIPDVILAYFSSGIGNVIKSGLQSLKFFIEASKVGAVTLKVVESAKIGLKILENFLNNAKIFSKNAYSELRMMFQEIIEYLKKVLIVEEKAIEKGKPVSKLHTKAPEPANTKPLQPQPKNGATQAEAPIKSSKIEPESPVKTQPESPSKATQARPVSMEKQNMVEEAKNSRKPRGFEPTHFPKTKDVKSGTLPIERNTTPTSFFPADRGLELSPNSSKAKSPMQIKHREEQLFGAPLNEMRQKASASKRQWAKDNLKTDSPDPLLLGRKVEGSAEADHIVPVDIIRQMPGFAQLNPKSQLLIVQYGDNFVPMSKTANSSRKAKTFEEWEKILVKTNTPYDKKYMEHLKDSEKKLKIKIQEIINEELKKMYSEKLRLIYDRAIDL